MRSPDTRTLRMIKAAGKLQHTLASAIASRGKGYEHSHPFYLKARRQIAYLTGQIKILQV